MRGAVSIALAYKQVKNEKYCYRLTTDILIVILYAIMFSNCSEQKKGRELYQLDIKGTLLFMLWNGYLNREYLLVRMIYI